MYIFTIARVPEYAGCSSSTLSPSLTIDSKTYKTFRKPLKL